MTWSIKAGGKRIQFTDGARLVVEWCDTFTPRDRPESLPESEWIEITSVGVQATAASAETADRNVPTYYAAAKARGLLEGPFRTPIDEAVFLQCRTFLSHAAENRLDISGGF